MKHLPLPLPNRAALLAAVCFTLGMTAVHAQSVYLGAGILGLQGGYAHRINDSLGARVDFMGLPGDSKMHTESGTEFKAKVTWNRVSALADWHPFKSSAFRLSGGISSNNMGVALAAATVGGTVEINGKTHTIQAGDSFTLRIKMPSTTPYLGIGYGHHSGGKGLGFHADLGVLVGGLKLSESRTGALADGGSAGITQLDVYNELKDLNDDLAKMKVLPQLTLGLSYRF
jgi:hypothetical protein